MMNLIYAIPENVGWAMVGATWTIAAVMIAITVRCAIKIAREWIEDAREEEEEEEA